MHLNRRIKIQLAIFTVIALAAGRSAWSSATSSCRHGVRRRPLHGHHGSAAQPAACIPTGNVTYRGTEVGRVRVAWNLTDTGRAGRACR